MDFVQENSLAVFGPEGASNPIHVRDTIRKGLWTSHTSGLADGHVQGNVVILPEVLASDFLRFCQRNPKPVSYTHLTLPTTPYV